MSLEAMILRKVDSNSGKGVKKFEGDGDLTADPTSLHSNKTQHPILISSNQEMEKLLFFSIVFPRGSCPQV